MREIGRKKGPVVVEREKDRGKRWESGGLGGLRVGWYVQYIS